MGLKAVLGLAAGVCAYVSAALDPAQHLELEIARLAAVGGELDAVHLELNLGHAHEARFLLTADRLLIGGSLELRDLRIACGRIEFVAGGVSCPDGAISLRHGDLGAGRGELSVSISPHASLQELKLKSFNLAGISLTASLAAGARGWQTSAALDCSSIADLLALAPGIADPSTASGQLKLRVDGRRHAGRWRQVEGSVTAAKVNLSSTSELQGLSGALDFALDESSDRNWSFSSSFSVDAGIAYVEPGFSIGDIRPGFVVEVLQGALQGAVRGHWSGSEHTVSLEGTYAHPGIADATFDIAAYRRDRGYGVRDANLQIEAIDAGAFYTTYLQPLLLQTLAGNLDVAGGLSADARVRAGNLQVLDLAFDDVHVYDKSGRFGLAGLNGSLAIHDRDSERGSAFTWTGGNIYRFDFGPGAMHLVSSSGGLRLASGTSVGVLGGEMRIDSLLISQFGRPERRIEISGLLSPIPMQDFTQALGWPILSGTLSGVISGLAYQDGDINLDGTLVIKAFDGDIVMRKLRIQDLFGVVPRLYADVDVAMIDLEQLTETFSFGKIEGRLSGFMHRLQLQAWQPVYFEAEFATPPDDDSPHRISQKAVNNIGAIGGGMTGALSGGLLRFFQEYSYGRLGVKLRLLNGYLQMGGLQESDTGFVLLSSGGLLPPWIEIRGTGRSIQWRALMDGFKTIARGGPIIK